MPFTPSSRPRDVDFGLIRMFDTLRSGASTEVRVFRDYEKAVLWARAGRS